MNKRQMKIKTGSFASEVTKGTWTRLSGQLRMAKQTVSRACVIRETVLYRGTGRVEFKVVGSPSLLTMSGGSSNKSPALECDFLHIRAETDVTNSTTANSASLLPPTGE